MNLNGKLIGKIAKNYIREFSRQIGIPHAAYLIGSSVDHVNEVYDGRRDVDILIVTDEAFRHSCPLGGYEGIVHQIDFSPGDPAISNFLRGKRLRLK